jgi:hypothetical protein
MRPKCAFVSEILEHLRHSNILEAGWGRIIRTMKEFMADERARRRGNAHAARVARRMVEMLRS